VVGVAPPEFSGLEVGSVPDIWVPLSTFGSVFSGPNYLDHPNNNFLYVAGRLKPGVAIPQAEAALTPSSLSCIKESDADTAVQGLSWLRRRFPNRCGGLPDGGRGAAVGMRERDGLQLRAPESGRKNWRCAMAIGASRWRITRQLVTESAIVAAASARAGAGDVQTGATAGLAHRDWGRPDSAG